jgi:hypothetical protein
MHYRNGREAKNGDKIVKLEIATGKIEAFGVLHSATLFEQQRKRFKIEMEKRGYSFYTDYSNDDRPMLAENLPRIGIDYMRVGGQLMRLDGFYDFLASCQQEWVETVRDRRDVIGKIGARLLAKHSSQAVLDAYFDAANEELETNETNH